MVVGRILGMAGKALAKKFLGKKLGKKGMSTFEKRKSVLQGRKGRGFGILNKDYETKYIGKIKKKKD